MDKDELLKYLREIHESSNRQVVHQKELIDEGIALGKIHLSYALISKIEAGHFDAKLN